MSKQISIAKVVLNERLTEDVYSMVLESDIAESAKPGQFVALYSSELSRLLPRPISICDFEESCLRIVYRVVGAGTDEFSKMKAGDEIRVMGPLGNGYPFDEALEILKDENSDEVITLVGGGVGVPPLLALAKTFVSKGIAKERIHVVLGYRNSSDVFLQEDFEKYATVHVATDDGSLGFHGNTVDCLKALGLNGKVIYSCGPKVMLHFLKLYAEEAGSKLYVSLEEKMACGIGACLACVCKSKDVDKHSNVKNKRVCKDGPVFDAEEVEL